MWRLDCSTADEYSIETGMNDWNVERKYIFIGFHPVTTSHCSTQWFADKMLFLLRHHNSGVFWPTLDTSSSQTCSSQLLPDKLSRICPKIILFKNCFDLFSLFPVFFEGKCKKSTQNTSRSWIYFLNVLNGPFKYDEIWRFCENYGETGLVGFI